jgi:hypothetical protein
VRGCERDHIGGIGSVFVVCGYMLSVGEKLKHSFLVCEVRRAGTHEGMCEDIVAAPIFDIAKRARHITPNEKRHNVFRRHLLVINLQNACNGSQVVVNRSCSRGKGWEIRIP